VPIKKEMHWLVPFAVKLLKSMTVPPVFIKLSVFELANLCEKVAHILENEIKAEDNESSAWQHKS
jgi:hypothetical protein